jgi:phage antirepressor YoqD-like protein
MELVLGNNNGVATMTSLQMVEYINALRKQDNDFTELLHKDFLRKVPLVLKGGERNFTLSYLSSQNKELPMYVFPKREAMLMAMSYSYDIQASVYDAWETAEKKLSGFSVPTTFKEALLLAVEQQETIEQQHLALTVAQPKIEFHDSVVASEGTMTMTEAAKSLGIGRNLMFAMLRDEGILCKDNTPIQKYLDQKWFEVETYTYKRKNGDEYLSSKTVVTGKGMTKLEVVLKELL